MTIQKILNKRLETGYFSKNEIDLRTHIEDLEILYGLLKSSYLVPTHNFLSSQLNSLGPGFRDSVLKDIDNYKSVPNPNYPNESREEFIARMIEKKKKRIEIVLDVADL